MTIIDKIDFQGDNLYIRYHESDDHAKSIIGRIVIIDWKANPELVNIFRKMFQNVVNMYLAGAGNVSIDWDKFIADLKAYEKEKGNGNK